MKATLVTSYLDKNNTAGFKAPNDIEIIFKKYFGKTKRISKTNLRFFCSIDSFIRGVIFGLLNSKKDRCVIVQWPLYTSWPSYDSLVCKFANRKIALIHDINSLRYTPNSKENIQKEISQLNTFDVVISHNEVMSQFFLEHGLKSKIINLECFDYLNNYSLKNYDSKKKKTFSICFAGNLNKSIFLKDLFKIIKSEVFLYGNKPNFQLSSKINYKGAFSPDEICNVLEGDFGLIWDGAVSKDSSDEYLLYTMYNNPHKLSLYIASGIPVIAWKKSAISKFITNNNIGVVINSLEEIEDTLSKITEDSYFQFKKNVLQMREKVISGKFTVSAIQNSINFLSQK